MTETLTAEAQAPATDRRTLANALRMLAMDAVEKARSGHPGMPMGMADIAETLWNRHLRHDPADPRWPDRDRFVLSNGHGSMLLYGLLHLTGYDLPLDELKSFRQLHSRTPGHPEWGITPGVETTTGPLGQGICNAVGMALAERLLADEFNRPGHAIVDHRTFVFAGDGCLMEGISHEACSLAGTLGLEKLVVFYDDNGISIDGHVQGWFTDDTPARFEAYGWRVIRDVDGHDPAALDDAFARALAPDGKPVLVCCKTVIGWGAPKKAGTHDVHGAPLGADEAEATRQALGWPHPAFEIPAEIRDAWDARARGAKLREDWRRRFDAYAAEHPDLAAEFTRRIAGRLPEDFAERADAFIAATAEAAQTAATRKSSQRAIEALAPLLPELLGGSADLTGSNLTNWPACRTVSGVGGGNYVHYGVREFGMTAIANGLALHGGFLPFDATFLVFSDYARNAVRMSALIPAHAIHVYTHDSIGLGEDGPTHQPVEHLAALRAIPNLLTMRPADTVEALECWQVALQHKTTPTAMCLSRQKTPAVRVTDAGENLSRKGAYELKAANGAAKVTLFGTGTEVALALKAAETLEAEGTPTRVVSVPCFALFEQQPKAYQDAIIGRGTVRVAVEAAIKQGWERFIGEDGGFVGMSSFGASAPAEVLYREFGITAEAVVEAAKARL